MRRVNIKIQDKIITKSFFDEDEFRRFVANDLGILDFNVVTIKVWDLKVGESCTFAGHRFSIQSKARVGNKLVL